MKLCGLHRLLVEDLAFSPILEADEEEKTDEKSEVPGAGAKKHEDSPAAKAYRASGMSQQEIADKAGLSKAEVSKYKSSDPDVHRDPSVKSLERLAQAGVNVRQMLPRVFR